MSVLYYISENYTNGFKDVSLDFAFLFSIFFGILVIVLKNPVVSVLQLIGLFFTIACYLMLIGINFIGLSYLLVYVGAVSILFLFILMLINVRTSELLSDTNNSLPLAFMTIIAFTCSVFILLPYNVVMFGSLKLDIWNSVLYYVFPFVITYFTSLLDSMSASVINFKNGLVYVTSNSWDGSLAESSHITSIGNIMYTNYSIWLIITSIILLLAMVGCIVITMRPAKTDNKVSSVIKN